MKPNFTQEEYQRHLHLNRALIVNDDEARQAEIAGIALANGFGCDYAYSAQEAWARLKARNGNYRFVITGNPIISYGKTFPKDLTEFVDDFDYSNDCEFEEFLWKSKHDKEKDRNEGLVLAKRIRREPNFKDIRIVLYGCTGREQASKLNAFYFGMNEPYLLNNLLRANSQLYTPKQSKPVNEKRNGKLLTLLKVFSRI